MPDAPHSPPQGGCPSSTCSSCGEEIYNPSGLCPCGGHDPAVLTVINDPLGVAVDAFRAAVFESTRTRLAGSQVRLGLKAALAALSAEKEFGAGSEER